MPTGSTGFSALQVVTLVAGSSVLAALLTQGLAWLREWRNEEKEGKFAALYVAIALETYSRSCAELITESRNYDSSDGHMGSGHSNIAELAAFPEVNWKAFGIGRTEQAMEFHTAIDSERAMIAGWWEFDDEDRIVPHVREKAAEFGLNAIALANQFRRQHGLTSQDHSDTYSTKEQLQSAHKRETELRVAAEARQAEFNARLMATAVE